MDFLVVTAEFKNMLKTRGYAASTVDCYSQYLCYFMDYLRGRDITDLKKQKEKLGADFKELSEKYAEDRKTDAGMYM